MEKRLVVPHWEWLWPQVSADSNAPECKEEEELPLGQLCGIKIELTRSDLLWREDLDSIKEHGVIKFVDLSEEGPAISTTTRAIFDALKAEYGAEGEHSGATAAQQLGKHLRNEYSIGSLWFLPVSSVSLIQEVPLPDPAAI